VITFLIAFFINPPASVQAFDHPNDAGKAIEIRWQLSPQDSLLLTYEIWRASAPEGPFEKVGSSPAGVNNFVDENVPEDRKLYYYKVRGKTKLGDYTEFSEVVAAMSYPQWFNKKVINVLIAVILYSSILIYYINTARRRGEKLFIRRIAGLEALDEAVGRATEMGKPILYVPGLSTITDIATLASLNILARVAKKAAEYETPLIVPNYNPIVMTVAQEVVKQGCMEAGRPDVYSKHQVFFLSDSQFAYASGVTGIMARERPATNLFIGMFFAESLILAEAGNTTGAIQIAGTDAVDQLPFFVVSCDYTIMGEELYAASAYLSREPLLLGSIKGQDIGKLVLLILIIVGSILGLFGVSWVAKLFEV